MMLSVCGVRFSVLVALLAFATLAIGQTESATISGRVTDTSGAVVRGTAVQLLSIERGTSVQSTTNDVGIYVFPGVQPGQYHVTVRKEGFRQIDLVGLVVNVQDHIEKNFSLQAGSVTESVTVTGGTSLVNTEDASVSTVVGRKFAEDLPMNGRSFQSLIELAPGVVVVNATSPYDGGQFSVNGQRANSNYWMVDGVSANFGTSAITSPADGAAGTLPATNALGGTNGLVSVDALEEFRIQTSTYAPEFGRTPGGQISIATRSGTNRFHGSLFEYLRNDALDASDWFNGYTNSPALPKAKERQNDFGGTLGGPVIKDRLFFFFSYEGLRLRLPQTTLTQVPDIAARQNALPAMQPFFNAFPIDPKQPDLGDGIAQYNASYSNPASSDSYSVRVDQKLTGKSAIFVRFNRSPSELLDRGGDSLNTVTRISVLTQTATVGLTWLVSPRLANDFRVNYSRNDASSSHFLDNFGGAVPLATLPLPSPFTAKDAHFDFSIFSLMNGSLQEGVINRNLQRQINLIDNVVIQAGTHRLKLGVDFRRLSPFAETPQYSQQPAFLDVPSAQQGSALFAFIVSQLNSTLLFRNLGAFAQDTWRISPRLTATYGVRWDLDFVPSALSGPSPLAVTGFSLTDFSQLAIAPAGTPVYKMRYGSFAPRVGIAYQVTEKRDWQTVVRGGAGVFYDLASTQVGNALGFNYPFGASSVCPDAFNTTCPGDSVSFPLSPAVAAPPSITSASFLSGTSSLYAFDPNLRPPHTLQWNVALEQGLGKDQTISASYVGAVGRKLLQSAFVSSPSASFPSNAVLVANTATSDYDALQLQFDKRLAGGLQALVAYSWGHSIDTGSTGSFVNLSNSFASGLNPRFNRGPSDFDVRQALSAAATYEIRGYSSKPVLKAITHGWSVQNIVHVHSAQPVDVYYATKIRFNQAFTRIRPDTVPGVARYLYGSIYPGGKALNPAAFAPPPVDPNTSLPLRQGDVGRNALRAFPVAQWDFAVHREFSVRENVKLQFRAELFNVLNHPNFGSPQPSPDLPGFGLATETLAQSLGSAPGGGSFDPLYQLGGPRSIELALKVTF